MAAIKDLQNAISWDSPVEVRQRIIDNRIKSLEKDTPET